MGEIRVTGLDDALLARLSQRAATHGLGAEEEVKRLVTSTYAAWQDPITVEMLAEARRQTAASVRSKTLDLIYESHDERA